MQYLYFSREKNEKMRHFGFFFKFCIELPKRSNHGKFHVKVCNWRAAMTKYIFGHFGVSKQ